MTETNPFIILPSGILVIIDFSWKNFRFLMISSVVLIVTTFYCLFCYERYSQTTVAQLPLFPQHFNASKAISFNDVEIVVISHSEEKSRSQYAQLQLQRLNLNFSLFQAIDFDTGDTEQQNEIQKSLHSDTQFDLNYTRHVVSKREQWLQISNWQNHLQIYFRYLDTRLGDPNRPLIILEDDIILKPIFFYYFTPSFYNSLPVDWEVLFLDRSTLSCNVTKKSTLEQWNDWIFRSSAADCCLVQSLNETSAYIIRTPSVARKLIFYSNKKFHPSTTRFWNQEILPNRIINTYSIAFSHLSTKKRTSRNRASLHLILKRMSRFYDATQKHPDDFPSNFYLRKNNGILKGLDDVNDD